RRHTRFSRDWSSDVCSSDLRIDRLRCFAVIDSGDPAHSQIRYGRLATASIHSPNGSTVTMKERRLESAETSGRSSAERMSSMVEIGRASCREREESWGEGGG